LGIPSQMMSTLSDDENIFRQYRFLNAQANTLAWKFWTFKVTKID